MSEHLPSANIQFLQPHDQLLVYLCAAGDLHTCLLKLLQFREVLAQHTTAAFGVDSPQTARPADLLVQLQRRGQSLVDTRQLLRQWGNAVTHTAAPAQQTDESFLTRPLTSSCAPRGWGTHRAT